MSIDPALVRSFEISDECLADWPCKHLVKVTLVDDREKSQQLGGLDVCSLIQAIALKNIVYGPFNGKAALKHFAEYSSEIVYGPTSGREARKHFIMYSACFDATGCPLTALPANVILGGLFAEKQPQFLAPYSRITRLDRADPGMDSWT